MSKVLLKIGLVLIPFYELIIKVFPFSATLVPDTRIGKSFLGMWLALTIFLVHILRDPIKKCGNVYLLLLIFFIPLSIHLAPKYHILVNNIDSTNYWVWKPFVEILCYFMLFLAVCSMNITKSFIRQIFNLMTLCAVIMAGYCILQHFGFDQFFVVKTGGPYDFMTQAKIVGTLGNSTLVAPFIAMMIPLALYLGRYVSAIALGTAVMLSLSSMAIGSMLVSVFLYSCLKWRFKWVFYLFLIFITLLGLFYLQIDSKNPNVKYFKRVIFNSNGRVGVWMDAVKTMKEVKLGDDETTTYPLTGAGLGSYPIVLKPLMKTKIFTQLHNDYLELFCCIGIIGAVLFILALLRVFDTASWPVLFGDYNRDEVLAMTFSFLCIALAAFGSFIWQLSPHNFYTVVLAGLLQNESFYKGELDEN